MDLVDQLKGLKARGGLRRRRLGEPERSPAQAQAPDPRLLAALLEGAEIVDDGGARLVMRRTEQRVPWDPGAVCALVGQALRVTVKPADLVVMDIETTGLAGGTGTIAFLIGFAHWEGQALAVEQALMPDYPDEPALLAWVKRRLAEFKVLVTYNGKTFDLPLLRTRLRLQGERSERPMAHLDLLPIARRLFGHRLRSCGLAAIEREILLRGRRGDLPGAAIPRAYFRYLDGHEIETMVAVFRHHATDLAATARLLAQVAAFYADPAGLGFGDAGDLVGLGEWAEQMGDLPRAREIFALAHAALAAAPLRTKIELRLADLSRRTGREAEAILLWRAVAERDPLAGWPAVRELVRWHEGQGAWRSAFEVLEAAWRRFEQARELRSQRGESRLPAAWRQWMAECETLRAGLRQAAREEQLALF